MNLFLKIKNNLLEIQKIIENEIHVDFLLEKSKMLFQETSKLVESAEKSLGFCEKHHYNDVCVED